MSILVTNSLTKVYSEKISANEVHAVENVSLKIETGEFVGIMGASGSGKTTLLKLLSGIEIPSSGTVKINNEDINKLNDDDLSLFRRHKLGFVFQDFNLMDSLTLKENIMLPMILDKKEEKLLNHKSDELMKIFDIYKIKNKYPNEVSGGQKQKTAVCRALVNDPLLVMADEPTGNLDSKSSNSIMNCFKKINEDNKSTIIMVTHDPFAASFCSRIIFIKDGMTSTELIKKHTRKEFLDTILDYEAILGGGSYEL
ncbi:ABC transporter ATP-binding protein [Clostridium neuense]|uniref:ABC transporter ATP-binding protein n=1 Tax=Clostridium neuense TaxID=1728934 RepID=A0ABW8TP37_9CLOT